VLTVDPRYLTDADAGRWGTDVTVVGSRHLTRTGPGFSIVRASRLTVNATAEPPRRGSVLTVRGHLSRADWETRRYTGHSHRRVALQFRPSKGVWATLTTVLTDRQGDLRTTVTPRRGGCFRMVFAGSRTVGAVTSKADCITLRSH